MPKRYKQPKDKKEANDMLDDKLSYNAGAFSDTSEACKEDLKNKMAQHLGFKESKKKASDL